MDLDFAAVSKINEKKLVAQVLPIIFCDSLRILGPYQFLYKCYLIQIYF